MLKGVVKGSYGENRFGCIIFKIFIDDILFLKDGNLKYIKVCIFYIGWIFEKYIDMVINSLFFFRKIYIGCKVNIWRVVVLKWLLRS